MFMKELTLAAAAVALLPSLGAASTLIVDRGLPTANINAPEPGKSNIAWGFDAPFIAGDTFGLTQKSSIDQLSAWIVAGAPGSLLSDAFSTMTLYLGLLGPSGTAARSVASTSIADNSAGNPNVSVSAVTYGSGANYQDPFGGELQIWQFDFLDLGVFEAGEYVFALDGAGGAATNTFIHASNAALGGAPADDADDLYHFLSGSAGLVVYGGPVDSNGFGWNKSSDLNIQVYATAVPAPAAVPVPATLPLLLTAFGAGAVALRRRKAGPFNSRAHISQKQSYPAKNGHERPHD